VGGIKDKFSEMANNCFAYGVSEDKGVVLTGPPGSGKTFLVRTWLSSNRKVHDIATSPSALQDPTSPVHGAVSNLEKVYDIAKMIAPTVIFFDEGDALAPKRSGTGGQPSDVLTNKFLNIIDGEIPLNKVFTVLTTNRLDILDAVKAPALLKSNIKNDLQNFVTHYDQVLESVAHVKTEADYPLVETHLESARREISQSPVRKGSIQLNEFLETELSQEPQVGFIIGVGANDMTGMLLPIATSCSPPPTTWAAPRRVTPWR
jgi:SpoVK/Ycf46/Vps4 family AAA+-type ATPase